ncbi:MAG: recombinase RecT [Spirochaetes bacterium]|nr:recombinase RecT [Spirochaetota bacterium]
MAEQKNPLIVLVNEKKEGMWGQKAAYLPANIDMNMYFTRALTEVMGSKKLIPLTKTPDGRQSIFNSILKAVQLGVQIGGTLPQAYIVPMGDKAELVVSAVGYKFICLTEPNKVLNDIDVRAVYDGDDFSIDFAGGTAKHTWDGKTKRGKLVGVYAIIEELNGKRRVDYITAEDIEKIRDHHSRAWRAVQDKKMKAEDCAWVTDPDQQYLKTAAKRFLKPYAAMKEGLAMALAVDDGEPVKDSRPIQDRVGDQLDDIIIDDATVEEGDPGEKTEPGEGQQQDKEPAKGPKF